MKKFEYETLKLDAKGFLGGKVDTDDLKSSLNEMGCNGWELVDMTASAVGYGETRYIICVFKRELA